VKQEFEAFAYAECLGRGGMIDLRTIHGDFESTPAQSPTRIQSPAV
jgi:hypothetical protein